MVKLLHIHSSTKLSIYARRPTTHTYNIDATLDQHFCDGDSTCTWDVVFNAAFTLHSVHLAEDADINEFVARIDARVSNDTSARINIDDVSMLSINPLVANFTCTTKLVTPARDDGKYPSDTTAAYMAVQQLHTHLMTHIADMQPVPAFPLPGSDVARDYVEKYMKTYFDISAEYGDGMMLFDCSALTMRHIFLKSNTRQAYKGLHLATLVPLELDYVDVLGKRINLIEEGRAQNRIRYSAHHTDVINLIQAQQATRGTSSVREFSRIAENTFNCFKDAIITKITTQQQQ